MRSPMQTLHWIIKISFSLRPLLNVLKTFCIPVKQHLSLSTCPAFRSMTLVHYPRANSQGKRCLHGPMLST